MRSRLDVLVDDTWGGDQWIEWKPLWEHDLDKGLKALRNGLETHLITLGRRLDPTLRIPRPVPPVIEPRPEPEEGSEKP